MHLNSDISDSWILQVHAFYEKCKFLPVSDLLLLLKTYGEVDTLLHNQVYLLAGKQLLVAVG